MNIFSPGIWESNVWQSIGVIVSIIFGVGGPYFSAWVEGRINKKDKEHVNAYKALFAREGSFTGGELIRFLFPQLIAAYGFSILGSRVLWPNTLDVTTFRYISIVVVLALTYGLSFGKRKTLARLLVWNFILVMLLFVFFLIGQKYAIPTKQNFTWVVVSINQHLPSATRVPANITSFLTPFLKSVPTDLIILQQKAVRGLFIWFYGPTLAIFLIFYTLHKQHRASQVSAYAYLSDKEKKEAKETVSFKHMEVALELRKTELELKQNQSATILQREALLIKKEEIELQSICLDVEKKRFEYVLGSAKLLIDTLYENNISPDMRTEMIRNILPSLKEFGQKESTTIITEFLEQNSLDTPIAVPVIESTIQ